MPEHEHEWAMRGPDGKMIPAKRITVDVPLEFDNVIVDLVLRNGRENPYDEIRTVLRTGVTILQDPEKGGLGGIFKVDNGDGTFSAVAPLSMAADARELYPDIPAVMPDPFSPVILKT